MSNKTTSLYFNKEDLEKIDFSKMPYHIAFINDGNRRWARKNKVSSFVGHQQGAEQVINIIEAAQELGIKVLTFYAFSTENWNRTQYEVNSVMGIIQGYLLSQKEKMLEKGVKLSAIGNHSRLPDFVNNTLNEIIEATALGTAIEVVLAIDYGSRDEICRGVAKILEDCLQGKIKVENINEDLFSNYLDTARWQNPDLLIRTSGEFRLSNFLLWQVAYTEVYTTETLWPDFTPNDLLQAIITFQHRKRRYGS